MLSDRESGAQLDASVFGRQIPPARKAMSKIDDDLKQALAATESADEVGARAVTTDSQGDGDNGRRNLGVLLTLLVLGGGILSFVLGQDGEQLTYAKDVKAAVENQEPGERNLRVQGVLVPGSLAKREEPCEYRFQVRQKDNADGAKMDVRFAQCIVPDTFRDVPGIDVEVTVTGQKMADHFKADTIAAKCPSKYEMQQRQIAGEQKPHGEATNVAAGEGPAAIPPMNAQPKPADPFGPR
jgi:cytochrome c-type biogenesis protein CcmE